MVSLDELLSAAPTLSTQYLLVLFQAVVQGICFFIGKKIIIARVTGKPYTEQMKELYRKQMKGMIGADITDSAAQLDGYSTMTMIGLQHFISAVLVVPCLEGGN